jgi:hypothetical protein
MLHRGHIVTERSRWTRKPSKHKYVQNGLILPDYVAESCNEKGFLSAFAKIVKAAIVTTEVTKIFQIPFTHPWH